MSISRLVRAACIGIAVAAGGTAQTSAQNLQVMQGAVSSALKVPMNRAVVVESETPFAEISIANPGIADISTLSDQSIYVLGKAPGRTTMTLLGPDGRLIANVEVQVSPDIDEFKERLSQILPGEQIEVRTANDGIVLSGVVSSTAKLDRALDLAERYAPERVSNLMSVGGTQQVMLEVRFAEMNRSVRKELSGSVGFFNPGGRFRSGVANNIDGVNNVLNGATVTTNLTGALGASFEFAGLEFAALLEALETKGVVRTLAEPNLTALSGQEARFLAGGEVPIPVLSDGGGVGVEFKPFGVEMNFTPTVVDGDQINLVINAAVSAIDPTNAVVSNGISINAFSRREATTTVEMRDGESFAIAGLLQDDFTDLASQVPWLGDLPVLGALFRSANYQREQSELVIIVTPHLVTPTRGEALALPTDRVRPPSEAELFLFGKVAGNRRQTGAAAEVSRQDFGGSYGYVME